MPEPTLRQVRMFLAVARYNSFRAAAERISTSQSTISIQIKGLEDAIGVPLFDRTTRVVRLTPAGAELLEEFERLAATADEVRAKSAQLAAGRLGQLKIGALPSIAAELLPRVIATFGQAFPDVRLEILETVDQELVAAIKEGRCDVCLTSARMFEGGMNFEALFSEELVAVLPSAHPLAGGGEVRIEALMDEPLILTKRGTSLRSAVNQAFADAGGDVFPAFEVTYIATATAFAMEGLGIALVPASSVRHMAHPGITVAGIAGQAGARTMGILQMEDTMSYPLQQQFIKVVRAVSKQLSG
ncbi:LysR family transcriptional regulator [Stenotrophomonas mori]|uniref:LysR family transcriptional regulator n=1 Tax=Stenotrophomonas mori TaxID=2871096 RepID=A0ABT0SIM0_9GAMM|nr:LysR family transcriptional regulator [Stenotrophomonas mori]MCL7714830.1 LysR family transcriptional regulator [Stenotrophomonas mori]